MIGMEIRAYDDRYRDQVAEIWKTALGYADARNDPDMAIDKKLRANDGLFFVAVEDEKAVGTIMAGYDGHRGWIYSLGVLPEYRKKRIGTLLLHHAESRLIGLGCVKINLQIVQSNEAVAGFYLKNGYRVEERISMGKVIAENLPHTPPHG